MKLLYVLTFTLLLGSISEIHANECASWGCITTVESVYVNSEGRLYVSTPLDENLANCTPIVNQYFSLHPSKENFDEIYSAILSAFMADKKIQIRIIEESSNCDIAYVVLSKNFS